jgi:hypothetical protein
MGVEEGDVESDIYAFLAGWYFIETSGLKVR